MGFEVVTHGIVVRFRSTLDFVEVQKRDLNMSSNSRRTTLLDIITQTVTALRQGELTAL